MFKMAAEVHRKIADRVAAEDAVDEQVVNGVYAEEFAQANHFFLVIGYHDYFGRMLIASGVDEKDLNCKIRHHFIGIMESV
ncbi:hypothetical protein M0R45_020004 [Rubus argutus]|uniref:Uncharacterized protein n=1 Tax=Rubus argutus TaxID=59490 RepID=A0AAW1X955_RUBAR